MKLNEDYVECPKMITLSVEYTLKESPFALKIIRCVLNLRIESQVCHNSNDFHKIGMVW